MPRSKRAIRPPARLAESAQPPPRKRPRTRPNVAPPTRTEAPTTTRTSATNVNVGAASPGTTTMAASGMASPGMPAAGAGSNVSTNYSTIVSSDSAGGESSCSNVNVTYDNSVFVRPNVIDQVDVHSNGVNVRPSPTGDCVNLGSLSGPDVNVRPNVSLPLSSQANGMCSGHSITGQQPVMVSLGLRAQIGQPNAVASFAKRGGGALGFAVPALIKQKIWDGEFVDFSQLLSDNSIQLLVHSQQQQSELVFAVEGGQMVIRPAAQPKKKIDNLDKWLSAFHVFMAIFFEKHPSRAAELLKYAETIRLASIQFSGFGWRTYDEQFRLRRAADPSSSWGEMDLELWVTVAAAATVGYGPRQVSNLHGNIVTNNNIAHASVANGGPFSTGNRSDGGVCFAFNKAQGCRFALCRFAHRCSACSRVGHNALSCRMLVGNSNARG